MNASILHLTVEAVKPDRRAARRAETETRLVGAATTLFSTLGYSETTLTAVAEHAGLAPRTVYLRFGTKAELLRRCIGVAIAGDTDVTPIAERDWMNDAMTAPTVEERVGRMASITATLMERAGPLLEVARQAAATEPDIAAAARSGRAETRRTLLAFWRAMADDGLLPPDVDVEWLGETATVLAHADTYLLLVETTGWSVARYRAWLETTWLRLVDARPT
jgi:AcrR family transcriptional regulator